MKHLKKLFKSIEAKIGEEEKFKGHLGENAETLYEALSLEDELGTKLEKGICIRTFKTRSRYCK